MTFARLVSANHRAIRSTYENEDSRKNVLTAVESKAKESRRWNIVLFRTRLSGSRSKENDRVPLLLRGLNRSLKADGKFYRSHVVRRSVPIRETRAPLANRNGLILLAAPQVSRFGYDRTVTRANSCTIMPTITRAIAQVYFLGYEIFSRSIIREKNSPTASTNINSFVSFEYEFLKIPRRAIHRRIVRFAKRSIRKSELNNRIPKEIVHFL